MLYSYLILALGVSIDSLGTGITYGLKNTRISRLAKLILFIFSFSVTSISLLIGNVISQFISEFWCNIVGCLILCSIGIWIIFQSLKKDMSTELLHCNKVNKNIYSFFLKSLGITIQIIRNPNYSDFDCSNHIDSKEALFLAIALSLDSVGVSIGSSIIGINSLIFPFFVSFFQLFFLSLGSFLGTKLKNISNIPDNIWSIFSGLLLCFIGISKLFF